MSIRKEVKGNGTVMEITMDRADRANSLVPSMLAGLEKALEEACSDAQIRVIVLTGAGRYFCSGLDLQEGGARQSPTEAAEAAMRLYTKLRDSPKPTVARVNGPVLGGGLGLLFACDVRVAVDTAYLAFPEVRRGIVPAVISAVIVPQLGLSRARELMLTGRSWKAADALTAGALHHVVPAGSLDEATERVVSDLLRGGPHAMRTIKTLAASTAAPNVDHGPFVRKVFVEMMASPESAHGIQSFLKKQVPDWSAFSFSSNL